MFSFLSKVLFVLDISRATVCFKTTGAKRYSNRSIKRYLKQCIYQFNKLNVYVQQLLYLNLLSVSLKRSEG